MRRRPSATSGTVSAGTGDWVKPVASVARTPTGNTALSAVPKNGVAPSASHRGLVSTTASATVTTGVESPASAAVTSAKASAAAAVISPMGEPTTAWGSALAS